MSNQILLEEEQIELLNILVETSRNTPRDKRQKFYLSRLQRGEDILRHPYLPREREKIYFGDLEVLEKKGLINLNFTGTSSYSFDVLPEGFSCYEQQKTDIDNSYDNIEKEIMHFFDVLEIQKCYSSTFKKWKEAESLLWKSDSSSNLTTIGHLCREVIQEFVNSLVNDFSPENVDTDMSHTIKRLSGVFSVIKPSIGNAEFEYLEGIMEYWKGMNRIIQRLEHGSIKKGKGIIWEDGRMVVFSTAFIVYEIHRAISKMK